MRDFLIVINSFIHDMATGIWIAILMMMYVISDKSKMITDLPRGTVFIRSIMETLWVWAVTSILIVLITGVMRVLTFKRYGWTGDMARDRKRLLLIKHILLGGAFLFGVYIQFMLMAGVRN